MKKIWRVFLEMLRLQFETIMVFRFDFFAPFFVDGSLFVIQLMAFWAIYKNVDTIGGWNQGEMVIYIGTFSLINAINMVIYFFGLNTLPAKVKSGELDLYLTKPISPLFRLTFEKITPGSIPLVLMSLCILIYGMRMTEYEYQISKIAAYCFWVLVMEILYYEMEVLFRAASLFLITNARLEQIEEAGISLCMKVPGIALYGGYKIIFYLVLPYGIMATFPVQSLIGDMNWKRALYGIGIVVLFSILTRFVWKQGLRQYRSASS